MLQDTLSTRSDLSAVQRLMVSQVPEVNMRKSRYSYGIECMQDISALSDFDREVDEVCTDHPNGRKTTRRVNWYLKKVCPY